MKTLFSSRISKILLIGLLYALLFSTTVAKNSFLKSEKTSKVCEPNDCFNNEIYECKLKSSKPDDCTCPCEFFEDHFEATIIVATLSFFSICACLLLIIIFFKAPEIREKPGDIIFGMAVSDLILSGQYLFHSISSGVNSSWIQPDDVICKVSSTIYIFGLSLQVLYNLSFFVNLLIEFRTTLKASVIPPFIYHAVPWICSILTVVYYYEENSVGMAIDGICSSKTTESLRVPLALMFLFILVPVLTLYNIQNKVPVSDKIQDKVYEFLQYYSLYAKAVLLIYLGLSMARLVLSFGIENYLAGDSYQTWFDVSSWIEILLASANPIILSAIRLNDPHIKRHWDTIFPWMQDRESQRHVGDPEDDLDTDLRNSERSTRKSQNEEEQPLRREISMTAETFEKVMENTSVLRQIKHTLKVQILYSILSSIHYFWDSRSEERKLFTSLPQNLFEKEAKMTREITITEEILKERLPFALEEIKDKQYGAVEGTLTVYAPKIFSMISSMDEVGQNIPESLDLAANFRRILKAGTNTRGGQSGEFFFFSNDNKLIIKSLKESELKLLLRILPDYVQHFKKNPKSLIAKIYSVFTFETGKALGREKYHLMLMRNINGLPSRCLERAYDVKGSTKGRRTVSVDELLLKDELKYQKTLKDHDFMRFEEKIKIEPAIKEQFFETLKKDVEFLERNNLLDYSFLILILNRNKTFTKRSPLRTKEKLLKITEVTEEDDNAMRFVTAYPHETEYFRTAFSHKSNQALSIPSAKEDDLEDLLFPGEPEGDFFKLPSTEENFDYHMGIIDYLIDYNWKKKLEVFFKKLVACNPDLDISVQRPSIYANRFITFVKKVLF